MIFKTIITEDWAMIQGEGSLDINYAEALIEAARIILRSGIPNIKLDLEKVDYISSAGVRALLILQKEAEAEPGTEIAIVYASKFVTTVLKMAGLQSLFSADFESLIDSSTQKLTCETKEFPQWTEITLSGSMNVFSVKWLVEFIRNMIEKGVRHLRLNCPDVIYISSAGIRSLLMIYKDISAAQGSFKIMNPSKEMVTVLKLAGLDTVLLN